MTRPRLHVNIDHVATLRQARREAFPSPARWAERALAAGADGITCHLRKDRRHVQDADVAELRSVAPLLNLESSLDAEMLALALGSRADQICLVPENRTEVTTEGGLDVLAERGRVAEAVARFRDTGAEVSLFVDPDLEQLDAARAVGAPAVELHTGAYASVQGAAREREFERLRTAAEHAARLGLVVHAGHGLDLANVGPIAALPDVVELNIGFALVARAVFEGVDVAIREMLEAIS
ncbi:MAG: pyridoxine 5'-phosphate synthase [Planctomycetota bacterium]